MFAAGADVCRSPFHDQLANSTLWGPLYDGRAIITEVHKKFIAGEASLEDCQKSLKEDYSEEVAKTVVGTWAYGSPPPLLSPV